jgi:hypothetical protein
MPLFEDRSAAFIVRVWCESGEVPGAVRAWRGSVEHVASGNRSFFTELHAVIAFMRPHLLALGIEDPARFWEQMGDLGEQPALVAPAGVLAIPPLPDSTTPPPAAEAT